VNRHSVAATTTVVCALALGTWVNSLLPNRTDTLSQPFDRHGAPGESVTIRTGTVEVTRVSAAPSVRDAAGRTATSTGLFVVATLRFTASGESYAVRPIQVRSADGRTFGGTQPLIGTEACGASQAGIPITCDVAIEVDPSALPGAQLIVHNYSSGGADDRAFLDLGIAADQVAGWTKASTITLQPSRHEGPGR